MIASKQLAFSYAIFAIIATVANIGAQDMVIHVYHGQFDILASMIVGTGAGIIVKYVLDKRYIFQFRPRNLVHGTWTFVLYTVMGLATTIVFWGFEFVSYHLFESNEMRYLGGVIGLAVGYPMKYQLDKFYVFPKETA